MATVRWTTRARVDLRAIYNYIATDSHRYAQRFVRSIIAATAVLKDSPMAGRVVPEFSRPQIRELIHRNYRVVYRLWDDETEAHILAVVHGAREMEHALTITH